MRLFTAINVNGETRARLVKMAKKLRAGSSRGNFSLPENMHLTLVFIGECTSAQAAVINDIIAKTRFEPFEMKINRAGYFSRPGGGQIWWAGVDGGKHLTELRRSIADKLSQAGFDVDKRDYNPHITLGREIITDMRPWGEEPFGETVTAVDLMKSERINGRLVYTKI